MNINVARTEAMLDVLAEAFQMSTTEVFKLLDDKFCAAGFHEFVGLVEERACEIMSTCEV